MHCARLGYPVGLVESVLEKTYVTEWPVESAQSTPRQFGRDLEPKPLKPGAGKEFQRRCCGWVKLGALEKTVWDQGRRATMTAQWWQLVDKVCSRTCCGRENDRPDLPPSTVGSAGGKQAPSPEVQRWSEGAAVGGINIALSAFGPFPDTAWEFCVLGADVLFAMKAPAPSCKIWGCPWLAI